MKLLLLPLLFAPFLLVLWLCPRREGVPRGKAPDRPAEASDLADVGRGLLTLPALLTALLAPLAGLFWLALALGIPVAAIALIIVVLL